MTDPEQHRADERASRLHDALAVEDLVAANHESNKTMMALVDHVRKETEARDRKIDVMEIGNRRARQLLIMMSGAILILVLLAVFNAVSINAAKKNAAQTAAITKQIDLTNQNLAANQKSLLDTVKQYNLVGFYCIRTNPATADPKAESFLKCMQRLYPGGPTLAGR